MDAKAKVATLAMWSIPVSMAVLALKLGAWWLTGSVALYSDALESTVNIVAAVVALVALKAASKPGDTRHHFGLLHVLFDDHQSQTSIHF